MNFFNLFKRTKEENLLTIKELRDYCYKRHSSDMVRRIHPCAHCKLFEYCNTIRPCGWVEDHIREVIKG